MNKKKSNGFIFFADSRRPYYDNEAGRKLGPRELVERAAVDWERMNEMEQEIWKEASKRRDAQDHQLNRQKQFNVPQPKMKQRVQSQLEKELIERAKVKGIDRQTAKQQLMDKLLWRNGDDVNAIVQRRWVLVVLSEKSAPDETPLEVVFTSIEKGIAKAEMRLRVTGAKVIDKEGVRDVFWNNQDSHDVNMAALQMSKFISGGWNSLVLVPAHQAKQLASLMHKMKKIRDQMTGRDTSSIRLDRLMCFEDVICVFRKVTGRPEVDKDDDFQWDQLKEMQMEDTAFFSRATCEHFTSCLLKCQTGSGSVLDEKEAFGTFNEPPSFSQNKEDAAKISESFADSIAQPILIETNTFGPTSLKGSFFDLLSPPPPGIPCHPSGAPLNYEEVKDPENQETANMTLNVGLNPMPSSSQIPFAKTVLRADAPSFIPAAKRISQYELYNVSFLNFAQSVESECALVRPDEAPPLLGIHNVSTPPLEEIRASISTNDFMEEKFDQPIDVGFPPGIPLGNFGRPTRGGFYQKPKRRQGRRLAQPIEPQGGFRHAQTITDIGGDASADQMAAVTRWLNSLSMQELKTLDSEYEHLREENPDEDDDFEEDCFPNTDYISGQLIDDDQIF